MWVRVEQNFNFPFIIRSLELPINWFWLIHHNGTTRVSIWPITGDCKSGLIHQKKCENPEHFVENFMARANTCNMVFIRVTSTSILNLLLWGADLHFTTRYSHYNAVVLVTSFSTCQPKRVNNPTVAYLTAVNNAIRVKLQQSRLTSRRDASLQIHTNTHLFMGIIMSEFFRRS